MAKKPRSQRRKKGKSLDGDSDDGGGTNFDTEVLSDGHTIAESIATWDDDDAWGIGSGDGSDNGSIDDALEGGAPSTSNEDAAEARRQRLLDALVGLEEFTTEKRSAKREGTLRRLFRAITQQATGQAGCEAIYMKKEEIVKACVHGIRAGNPTEQYAACRVLEATSVVLGGNEEEYYELVRMKLSRVVDSKQKAPQVRAAALRALALAAFIGDSDEVAIENLMEVCEQVAEVTYRGEIVPTILRATALDAWALLSTCTSDLYVSGQDDFTTGRGLLLLPLLKNALDTSCTDLRAAAGETISVIHEARLNLGITGEEGENTTERQFSRGSWEGTEWEVIMDEMKQRIAELSVESGHHMSKKAKKQQRATFREFMSTIVDDEPPQEVINFRGGSLTLDSWREIVQLNFIRHCLQGGFQIQLMTNATLQAIFGADGRALNEFSGYSQVEKRLILSKTSEAAKAADLDMTRKRKIRVAIKHHFLTADGEGI